MKLNLIYGPDNYTEIAGHIKIDLSQSGVGYNHLDEVCEDSECTSIIAHDVIDYFSSMQVDDLVSHWIAKLRHKAKIVIGGIDVGEISRALLNKEINLIEANILLFGSQEKPWQFRKSAVTADHLANYLKGSELRILKNRLSDYRYVVEAERP